MTRLYITEHGARVAVRGGRIVVSTQGDIKHEWPIDQVEGVMCFGPINVTGPGTVLLLKEGIPVHYFTSGGTYRGRLSGEQPAHLFVRMAQHDRWRDGAYRLTLARDLVQTKIAHQAGLIRRRVAARLVGTDGGAAGIADELEGLRGQVVAQERVEALMGLEGACSRRYFEAFAGFVGRDFVFEGRNRRPPRDPVNALLSLGYSLLGAELAGLLYAAGFDASLGFLHGFQHRRMSLALDLLEELRQPVIDAWVLELVNRRRVLPEDFEDQENGGVYLEKSAFRKVLRLYHDQLGDGMDPACWRFRMGRRVRALCTAVLEGTRLEAPVGWE